LRKSPVVLRLYLTLKDVNVAVGTSLVDDEEQDVKVIVSPAMNIIKTLTVFFIIFVFIIHIIA